VCNTYGIIFLAVNVNPAEVRGKKVLEVGALDVNGSIRPIFESFSPKEYVGVDLVAGKGVDIVCPAEKLLEKFKPESFDVLVSTEMIEHVNDWRTVIHNFKALIKPDGLLLLTTRSIGFPYHGFPYDFWRFEEEDIVKIFSDCSLIKLEKDPQQGVFAKIVKPIDFVENDLSNYRLYSIITGNREKENSNPAIEAFLKRRKREVGTIRRLLAKYGTGLLSRLP
jgi:SAM-dependent methyltransferase